jgi:hypothetical protein
MNIFEFRFSITGDSYAAELTTLLHAHFGNSLSDEPSSYGIYLATATAGVEESVDFWKNTLEKTPAFVNPANFPYTLSNAPASCIAKALNVKGPVHTLVGGKDAVTACMLNALTDLDEGTVQNVLVVGFDRTGSNAVLNGMLVTVTEEAFLFELCMLTGLVQDNNPSELIRLVLTETSKRNESRLDAKCTNLPGKDILQQ